MIESNPFSGIITQEFKQLFTDMISAMLYDDACTIPCELRYGVTRYEDCPNCNGGTVHVDGGPMPFPFGAPCPMCNGQGKRPVETSETIHLMVIWDSRQFVNRNNLSGTVLNQDDIIQTITFKENIPKLRKAKELIVAREDRGYQLYRYEKYAGPSLCGLGTTDFAECLWKRSG